MEDTINIIEEYVARVLPHGKVTDILLEKPLQKARAFRIDAEGYVSFGRKRGFPAYFEIKERTPSLAALQGAIAYLQQVPLPEGDSHAKLLLAPYLSDNMQAMLREGSIGFIDGAGNAWIDTDTILVDRRGYRPDRSVGKKEMQNVFADKATLVSRLLFSGEKRGVREISALLDEQGFSLTPGYVSKVVAALVQECYAKRDDRGVRLVNRALFLEEWVASYRRVYARASKEGWYYPASDMADLAREMGPRLVDRGVITGRAGAYLVDPYALFDSIDVLAKDQQAVADAFERMGAKRVERGANINLIQPPYSISSFYGSRCVDDVPVASDIQLYLDVRCEKKRGLEAAEHLFERKILPIVEGDSA